MTRKNTCFLKHCIRVYVQPKAVRAATQETFQQTGALFLLCEGWVLGKFFFFLLYTSVDFHTLLTFYKLFNYL